MTTVSYYCFNVIQVLYLYVMICLFSPFVVVVVCMWYLYSGSTNTQVEEVLAKR